MADDNEEAEDERAVELSSVSAIYPELVKDLDRPFSASISIPVELIDPLAIVFPSVPGATATPAQPTPPRSDENKSSQEFILQEASLDPSLDVHLLSHLPPLQLHISLPDGYPNDHPPVLHLDFEISWLPKNRLQELEAAGAVLWEDCGRAQMIFSYIDHLREGAESGFGLAKAKGKGRPWEMSSPLKLALLDFDVSAKRAQFEQQTFDCEICLEPKKGAVCHKLNSCGHVFCVACLQDFYNSCITEGDVGSVKCIAPKCDQYEKSSTKRRRRDRTLEPSELLQIPLEQEMVQRYVVLKRKQALESDRTTTYCPRQWCQGPARSKKTEALDRDLNLGSDDEDDNPPPAYNPSDPSAPVPPPAERLAICTDCSFAFCRVCQKGWHGEFYVCFPQWREVELTAEEKASEDYMLMHTSPCPTCDARCQKTHGCNHMICFKCNTHFCYLCSSWLDKDNPYRHFNDLESGCYMRLWELEAGDGADVGNGFAGGVAGARQGLPMGPAAAIVNVPVGRYRDPIANENWPDDLSNSDDDDHYDDDSDDNSDVDEIMAAIFHRHNHPDPAARNAQREPPPAPNDALQRFLQLAQNDEEDEWDSDELEEEEGEDEGSGDDGFGERNGPHP
ncbi:MAG: hypothetical protein LQ351_002474 [Letrouitia transgressa]|nr:MAG: hypothetical protein LQ351_002474 [Letrouitia transgressa]